MTSPADKRLIEDYIPIKAISKESIHDRSIRNGHINTLHLWWARRPLVASRAAVFGALVSANAQPQIIDEQTKQPMTLTKFMIELCKWELSPTILDEARRLIREAYPDSPPKVLDMFAGGGSIPLEALRLGCEAYALDLNPVAHIIQLATLVYPQKYGKQLAEDVRKWGEWVLERVRAEVGDLYPLISDPDYTQERATFIAKQPKQVSMFPSTEPEQMTLDDVDADSADAEDDVDEESATIDIPAGYLQPVAYLWTRTVTCPNPACRASVPLVRQTWLKKKKGNNIALAMKPHPTENRMAFYVKHARDEQDFGFDPAGFSQRGNSICYRCGTTVTSEFVKIEGKAGRMSAQMMATVCVRPNTRGKVYLSPDEHNLPVPDEVEIHARLDFLTTEAAITVPFELLPEKLTGGMCTIYGLTRFGDLFTTRQMLMLLTFVKHVHLAYDKIKQNPLVTSDYVKAIITYIGLTLDRLVTISSTQSRWRADKGERVVAAFARQAIPMIWDYAETMPFNTVYTSWSMLLEVGVDVINHLITINSVASVERGSAMEMQFGDGTLDAIITDPPYYDNISYADLSDFFYVWMKRTIGFLYPEHFGSDVTPKKKEAIAASYRHSSEIEARKFYEDAMLSVFRHAFRISKPNSVLVTVYAHKTTAGWSTVIASMRNAGFYVTEAWPLDTEVSGRSVSQDTAALASSFFLVARKRHNGDVGHYGNDVLPKMQRIVAERVRFFLAQGITGADLNIAVIGAGLAPYTCYARVELPNGEELTASAYLDLVQAEVVRVLLGEAAKTDSITQYYIMARQYYGSATVEFDEANTLARAAGIELDTGVAALTKGKDALVEKKGAKVRLRDYTERGDSDDLGLITESGAKAPLIDVLHRVLWLVEHDNGKIQEFLLNARPDRYLLRVAAQTLGGRGLAAEPTPGAVRDDRSHEQRSIDTLLASWRRLFEEGTLM